MQDAQETVAVSAIPISILKSRFPQASGQGLIVAPSLLEAATRASLEVPHGRQSHELGPPCPAHSRRLWTLLPSTRVMSRCRAYTIVI